MLQRCYPGYFPFSPVKCTLTVVLLTSLVSACSDSSSPAAGPGFTVSATSILEGDASTRNLDLTVTLDTAANGNATVDYSTADGTATAADNDYTSVSGTITINAGDLSASASIPVIGDKLFEGDETFTVSLSNASANVTLPANPGVTITILDDDHLNDTGVTTCSDGAALGLACPQAGFPDQDAETGRDIASNDDSDGKAGFSFAQLDANGDVLTAKSTDYATTPWSCILDNNTGLMWEVKSSDGGLHDQGHTYTWYNSTGVNDGGNAGTADGGDNCFDTARCDTEKYVADVNAAALCGYSDWRLPAINELLSIIDMSVAVGAGATLDTTYFANTGEDTYQSSSPQAGSSATNYVMRLYPVTALFYPTFSTNLKASAQKSTAARVMLVRDL